MLRGPIFLVIPIMLPGSLYPLLIELAKAFNDTSQRVIALIVMYFVAAFIAAAVTYENNPYDNKLKPVIVVLSIGALLLFSSKTVIAVIYFIASIFIVVKWHKKFKDKPLVN
ncbi:hypothetical protein [Acinetobacter calcoaceticus]|uniref:hypothetical protein n=1 Tax=Acinetobacter calcoaceticus TaxID=471 RepID=UPI001E56D76B|nr:hypothetical protein [Acinetobacter calcoaceticus]UGQ30904.1 hypothetical protein LRO84_05565 [Acinetobacter calcoaceticus]